MKRKCAECPTEVQAVCRHAFGKFWDDKSHGGEGCDYPLDGVAEAWRKAGWTPDAPESAKTAIVRVPCGGGVVVLSRPPERVYAPPRASGAIPPTMPRRPVRPTASKIQSGMPTRPKVSAALMRQANLFFGRMK